MLSNDPRHHERQGNLQCKRDEGAAYLVLMHLDFIVSSGPRRYRMLPRLQADTDHYANTNQNLSRDIRRLRCNGECLDDQCRTIGSSGRR